MFKKDEKHYTPKIFIRTTKIGKKGWKLKYDVESLIGMKSFI